jgi:hypothetical protein
MDDADDDCAFDMVEYMDELKKRQESQLKRAEEEAQFNLSSAQAAKESGETFGEAAYEEHEPPADVPMAEAEASGSAAAAPAVCFPPTNPPVRPSCLCVGFPDPVHSPGCEALAHTAILSLNNWFSPLQMKGRLPSLPFERLSGLSRRALYLRLSSLSQTRGRCVVASGGGGRGAAQAQEGEEGEGADGGAEEDLGAQAGGQGGQAG